MRSSPSSEIPSFRLSSLARPRRACIPPSSIPATCLGTPAAARRRRGYTLAQPSKPSLLAGSFLRMRRRKQLPQSPRRIT